VSHAGLSLRGVSMAYKRKSSLFPIALSRRSLSIALDGISIKQIDPAIARGDMKAHRVPGVKGVRITVDEAIAWVRSWPRHKPTEQANG
jgi:hypothetical protein